MHMPDSNPHADAMHEQTPDHIIHVRSREQLSALMDNALPADETRFLLRRLQHDAALGECWDRWRLVGETMRGMAPARRLPADFSARVAVAIAGQDAAPASATRRHGWWRWGGGAAVAASLAVAALALRQAPVVETPAVPALSAAAAAEPVTANDGAVEPRIEVRADASEALAATALAASAVAARPQRQARQASAHGEARTNAHGATVEPRVVAAADLAPAADSVPVLQIVDPGFVPSEGSIATRPWPRAVLPQYAGNNGLTVGFGQQGVQAVAPFERPRLPAAPFVGNAPEGTAPAGDAEPAQP